MSDLPNRSPPPSRPLHDLEDDALLAALAALAREEAARGPDPADLANLERLAAGELPAEDHARLVGALPRETVALYEPLDAGFRARATKTAL